MHLREKEKTDARRRISSIYIGYTKLVRYFAVLFDSFFMNQANQVFYHIINE